MAIVVRAVLLLIVHAAPAHHLYPPGYPDLLAVWMAIAGQRFSWFIVLPLRKYLEEARTGHWTLAARTGASAQRLFAARQ